MFILQNNWSFTLGIWLQTSLFLFADHRGFKAHNYMGYFIPSPTSIVDKSGFEGLVEPDSNQTMYRMGGRKSCFTNCLNQSHTFLKL